MMEVLTLRIHTLKIKKHDIQCNVSLLNSQYFHYKVLIKLPSLYTYGKDNLPNCGKD